MKCDELKASTVYDAYWKATSNGDNGVLVYLKEEVDAVIADFQKTNVALAHNSVNLNTEIKEAVNTMKSQESEIVELKQKLENVQASMYCDVVDVNMENRRLKRALWLARANRADGEFIYWCARLAIESGFTKADIRGYSVNTKRKLRTIGEWIEVWKNVKSKCLKKAEEYKR